jgi:serine/threonine protein kinase
VDVYSYGNILYSLLQGQAAFRGIASKEAAELVMKGVRPAIYEDIWNSTDPVVSSLKDAMIMCHEHDPEKRTTARHVENFLKGAMRKYDPGQLEKWGDA